MDERQYQTVRSLAQRDKLIYWARQEHPSAQARLNKLIALQRGDYDPLVNGELPALGRKRRKIPRYLRSAIAVTRAQPRKNTGTWTAFSTPPYFTALAIWPAHGSWTGGGVFQSEKEIILFETLGGLTPVSNGLWPSNIRIIPVDEARAKGQTISASARRPPANDDEQTAQIRRLLKDSGVEWIDWIYRDGADVLFAADGCVYRLNGFTNVPATLSLHDAQLLADFRDRRFTLVSAPTSALS